MNIATQPLIGHNNPPGPTPFEAIEKKISDLYNESKMWLDGEVVTSCAQADGIANLLAMLRAAESEAEALRVAEKKPFDEKISEIQRRFAPLIADTKAVRGKTVIASEACRAALEPWLLSERKRLDDIARQAREEADRQRHEAEAALRASDAQNLAEREAAETLLRDARRAETAANVASRQTPTAGGALGRAAGLRTVYVVSIDDPVAAARTVWGEARDEMMAFLQEWAERQVRNGRRKIPGFAVSEERRAV